jgi:hypothetical protein
LHVSPTELRVVHRGSLVLRLAVLGPVAAVIAELPPTGSLDTSLEEPCVEPHWGIVLRGDLEMEQDGERRAIAGGSTFYVPGGGAGHRFFATGRAVVAGFVPLEGRDPEAILPPAQKGAANGQDHEAGRISRGSEEPERLAAGEVRAEGVPMGPWVMMRVTFGPTSGFGADFCDAPHWGLVVAGSIAIEYEDDVEVLGTGDVFHTPQGPPGHRLEVADGATIVDFTPTEALGGPGRLSEWRQNTTAQLGDRLIR